MQKNDDQRAIKLLRAPSSQLSQACKVIDVPANDGSTHDLHRLSPANGENESIPTTAETSQSTHYSYGELYSDAVHPESVPLGRERTFDRQPAHKQYRNDQCEQACDKQSEQPRGERSRKELPAREQLRAGPYRSEQPWCP